MGICEKNSIKVAVYALDIILASVKRCSLDLAPLLIVSDNA